MLVKLQKGQAGCKEVTGKQDWILYNTVEIDHDNENIPRGKRTDVVVVVVGSGWWVVATTMQDAR